jgi:hypothetical protein
VSAALELTDGARESIEELQALSESQYSGRPIQHPDKCALM